MDKESIRAHVRSRMQQSDQGQLSDPVVSNLRNFPLYQKAKNILAYLGKSYEVNLDTLFTDKKYFFVPMVDGDALLCARYSPDLIVGEFGVRVPRNPVFFKENLDLVIVPGLAFSEKGIRLGHGLGYYDRFLSSVRTQKIGVCFEFQILQVPMESHDICVDFVITEKRVIRCRQ